MSVLALSWRQTALAKGTSARDWLDFVVDGESLAGLLGVDTDNLIGFLGWMGTSRFAAPDDEQHLWDELLLDKPSSLHTGRVRLYVCAVCGHDIGCGAITAIVRDEDGNISWGQFGFEQDPPWPDEPIVRFEGLEHIGPFLFDISEYRDALLNLPTKEVNP